MKKKLISLVFGLFMAVFSVFSLSSCSTVSTNHELENSKTVLKVGDSKLSKSDIINSFYTYYQNNNSYFSYYDNESIEESFYTWAIMKEVINQKAGTSIYDAETNPNGFIVYTKENQDNVWKNVYNYFYSQVSGYEKNIYKSAGYAEESYPAWLSAAATETAETKFEAYTSKMPEGVSLDKSEAVKKSTDAEILDRVSKNETSLMKYLFEHLVETDKDGNETRKSINDIISEEQRYIEEIKKDKFVKNARAQAYVDYMSSLRNSAYSAGKNETDAKLLNDEIIRVYNAYYESEVTTLLQKYYLDEYLISGEETPLTEKAIVEAFLNKYYSDYQTYQFEDAYITTMTAQEGASLVLYHYKGQNYFFTVQHILIKNDDFITEEIKNLQGYDSAGGGDYDASGEGSIATEFNEARKNLTDSYFMATSVNEKNVTKSIVISDYANYYYYDKERADKDHNWGYITVVVEEVEENGKTVKHYFEDSNSNGVADGDNGDAGIEEKIEIESKDVKYLATDEDVLACYEENLLEWRSLAQEYAGYVAANNAEGKKTIRDAHDDMAYVFDTVDNLIKKDDTADTIENVFKSTLNEKIASYLFVQLEWVFSSDSLGNALSNKMGYVMSNYPDEHGSWVPEFADGARDLIKKLTDVYGSAEKGIEEILNDDFVISVEDITTKIISTYGYHIIKIENIFAGGSSIIDLEKIKENLGVQKFDLTKEAQVDAIIEEMKKTYVCNASNQTLYDYYFDELYTGFVGSSWLGDTSENATSGTYFLKLEYEWLYELYQADKIEYINKIGYEELLESIN